MLTCPYQEDDKLSGITMLNIFCKLYRVMNENIQDSTVLKDELAGNFLYKFFFNLKNRFYCISLSSCSYLVF